MWPPPRRNTPPPWPPSAHSLQAAQRAEVAGHSLGLKRKRTKRRQLERLSNSNLLCGRLPEVGVAGVPMHGGVATQVALATRACDPPQQPAPPTAPPAPLTRVLHYKRSGGISGPQPSERFQVHVWGRLAARDVLCADDLAWPIGWAAAEVRDRRAT
jgi:hypothetical protein